MFLAGISLFTQPYTADPVMWRSFTDYDPLMRFMHAATAGLPRQFQWFDYSEHHTLNLAAEAGLSVGLMWWFARERRVPVVRFGILASYGAVLTWAIHEGMWWLTYAALWKPDPIVFSGFGEMLTVSLLILTPALGLYAPKRFLAWMSAFYLVWMVAGFPITESYGGPTSSFYDFGTNLWEVASWAWACAGFYLLERKGLLAWFTQVEKITLAGQES